MNCVDFEKWLDEGMPRESSGPAQAHLERCPACAAFERAALEVDRFLAAPPPAAPRQFTDRVLARIARPESYEAQEPSWLVSLAIPVAIAALAVSLGGAVVVRIASVARWSIDAPASSRLLTSVWHDPNLLAGVVLALAPAMIALSVQVYREAERRAS